MIRIFILSELRKGKGAIETFVGMGPDGDVWVSPNPRTKCDAEKLVYLGEAIPILSVGGRSLMPLGQALKFAPSDCAVRNIRTANEVFLRLLESNRIEAFGASDPAPSGTPDWQAPHRIGRRGSRQPVIQLKAEPS